ncbi:unnamed protein product, partial [Symbiodinium pilosum]
MIKQDNFVEGATSQVVISDFSAAAVRAFLRFLHFGEIERSLATILEVGMLADKYEVTRLHKLCTEYGNKVLDREVQCAEACKMFALANRFQHTEFGWRALEVILGKPEEALKARPSLSARLVREILATEALCLNGEKLMSLMSIWAEADSTEASKVEHLLEAYAKGVEQAYLRLQTRNALFDLSPKMSKKCGFGCADHVACFRSMEQEQRDADKTKMMYSSG